MQPALRGLGVHFYIQPIQNESIVLTDAKCMWDVLVATHYFD